LTAVGKDRRDVRIALRHRSRSDRQPPSASRQRHRARSPAERLDRRVDVRPDGLTMTMLSPGSEDLAGRMIAVMPAVVTRARSAPTGFSCAASDIRAIVRRNAGIPRFG